MGRLLEELSQEEKGELTKAIINKKRGMLDVEWSELVDEFDLDVTADTLRKAGVGAK